MAALIFVLTFVVVTLVILGVWVLATVEPGQELIRRRMEAVRKAERRGDVSLELKLARDEMLSSVPWIHRLMLHWTWPTTLQAFITQAGLQMKAAKLILISLVTGMATYLLVAHSYPQFGAALLAGLVAVGLPFAYVAWLRQKRL